ARPLPLRRRRGDDGGLREPLAHRRGREEALRRSRAHPRRGAARRTAARARSIARCHPRRGPNAARALRLQHGGALLDPPRRPRRFSQPTRGPGQARLLSRHHLRVLNAGLGMSETKDSAEASLIAARRAKAKKIRDRGADPFANDVWTDPPLSDVQTVRTSVASAVENGKYVTEKVDAIAAD